MKAKHSPVVLADYEYGFFDPEKYPYRTQKGLNANTVKAISDQKEEPTWLRTRRENALKQFEQMPLPDWGGDLAKIDFDQITYYIKPSERVERDWNEVPETIKNTFERLGIPESERKFLAGVGAQYESEAVYHNLKEEWSKQGVIFMDTDSALKKYPALFQQYLGTVVPAHDNKFAALNTAVWSGGTFLYVPKGVQVTIPLQNYFRINAKNMGQFERTLIIAEEGSYVHYAEGCTAPNYSTDSLHAAVVEVIAKKNARVRYTTIQNWSNNVYNLVTKRAVAHAGAVVEWVDGNLGSKLTMKYPSVYLVGEGAHADILSLALAGEKQHLDAGAKAVHLAKNTTSVITSKSVSHHGGRASYRGLVEIAPRATGCRSKVKCDALILDAESRSDTYPTMRIKNGSCQLEHEATVSKIGDDQLFYARSRGITEEEANTMLVNGFIEPVVKELPMEYAVELNRLISLEMEGSVG